jgi:hypothetical protein
MSSQIEPGSRISDVIHILPDPIEYVSGVVSNFVSYGYSLRRPKYGSVLRVLVSPQTIKLKNLVFLSRSLCFLTRLR